MTLAVTLAHTHRHMSEPVLRDLRLIITHYNALAGADNQAQADHLTQLLNLFFPVDTPRLNRLSGAEISAFLTAIPTVCQLDQADSQGGKPMDWGYLYAHLAAALGWTHHYIDEQLTLSRLNEMQGYFDDHPATHLLVAAYLGYENPNKTQSVQSFFDNLRAAHGKPRKPK
jgi:hypothetical protein